MGVSPGLHPYHHAISEATACVDLLRAVRAFCATNGFPLNDRLFLCGYSQGGHATLSLLRDLESLRSLGRPVVLGHSRKRFIGELLGLPDGMLGTAWPSMRATFGAIAAANALSDVWAMGGRPIFALNLVAFPVKLLPMELLAESYKKDPETQP